jgi:hypothetical protein
LSTIQIGGINMVLAQFSLSGPLINAVSETAYDLNGDTHLYDFLVMRVDEAASADPARFAWPRAAQTVRMLFDGTPPAMGIHIGDTLRLTGPVTTIFTNTLHSVPPLHRGLKNLVQQMISDARRWQKLAAGAQGTAFGRLTAQFEAERLPFDQWLQKQTALFGTTPPQSLSRLQTTLKAHNTRREALLTQYTQAVLVFVQQEINVLKHGPLPHPPVHHSPPGTVIRLDYTAIHKIFAAYVAEVPQYQKLV